MGSALVTLVGKMKAADGEEQEVTITGLASIIMLYPGSPPPRPHPEPPLGIWGPTDPRPGYWVPGAPGDPGYKPPGSSVPPDLGFWGPPGPWIGWWVPGAPGAPDAPGDGAPPFERKVAWTPESGWVVAFVPTGEHVTPSK